MLCSSYSGDTEETLACFEAAEALGAKRLVASTGGPLVDRARETDVPVVGLPGIFQPRAAVAYMVVVAAEVASWPASRPASTPRSTPPPPSSPSRPRPCSSRRARSPR